MVCRPICRKHIMLHKYIFILSSLSLVYSIGIDDPRYLGCYRNGMETALPHSRKTITNMTISLCIEKCRGEGFAYAGVSSHDECYCGDFNSTYDKHGQVADSECNFRCGGNETEMCGGHWLLSIYRVCENYKFGNDCEEYCHCGEEFGSECNPVNGKCRGGDGSCQARWKDWPHCQDSCNLETYGLNCVGQCHCRPGALCDKDTGHCDKSKGKRCADGYHHWPKCQAICRDGYFGEDCASLCHCDSGSVCNHVNGSCSGGEARCAAGWKDWPNCQSDCPSGSYGYGCNGICLWHCANNATCNVQDGTCPGGECQDGFIGPRCEIPQANSINLLGFVMAGVIIVVLIQIVILIVVCRKPNVVESLLNNTCKGNDEEYTGMNHSGQSPAKISADGQQIPLLKDDECMAMDQFPGQSSMNVSIDGEQPHCSKDYYYSNE